MSQLTLDFSKINPLVSDNGKKTERIPFTCSSEFKEFLELFARVLDITVSELCNRYVLEGMRSDLGSLFMAQPHLDKTLRELLAKKT